MNIREKMEQQELELLNPYAAHSAHSRGRERAEEECDVRTVYQRDRDRILHSKAFRRLKDKTQVFLAPHGDHYRNRLTHTLEVSQIARTIAKALRLNEDLVEAIALGHDLGHTPFGHAGERILSSLYQEHTGRYFNHNVHSVRVLDDMVNWNISLQTLDGILCHNGELELKEYRPCEMSTFVEYDKKVEACYVDEKAIGELISCTLEGCVMRICDIIAYLGKDRQDAMRLNLLKESPFTAGAIGTSNGEIINNFSVNIIENSYGKDYLKMDEEYFDALRQAKKENYEMIYNNKSLNDLYENEIRPMFGELYEELLRQAESGDKSSVFYRHHMAYMEKNNFYVKSHVRKPYAEQEKNQLVVDYLASMTDDYFIALYHYLFPKGKHDVKFVGYFDL